MRHFKDMMEQVKKLKNGVGVQSLLDSAYKILQNPIVMFNTEYTLQAYTDVECDDVIWQEIIGKGFFGLEMQNLFHVEGFIEDVANAHNTVLLHSNNLKYDRITGKVFNKNNSHVANLVIVASNSPFDEGDIKIFEVFCKILSREISKHEFYQEYEQTHQEMLITNLITGSHDVNLDLGQLAILYDSLKSNLYLAVADISYANQEFNTPSYYRDLFKKINPNYMYAVYSNYIVLIISTEDESLNVKKDLKELISFIRKNNIYVGLSSKFENLFDLNKYYAEALDSLECVLDNKCSQRLYPYSFNSIKTMKQIKELCNGEGIQYFLNKGPEIFGNPLLFHDLELNLLACTENIEIIDPIWREIIIYGTSSNETIDIFDSENFISTMENTKGGALLVSPKIKYDRISWRIYSSDKIMIGCLSIVNSDQQFCDDELVLFGAFCNKFSNEISKIKFYSKYGQSYSDTVINRLISGKIDDYTFYTMDIGNLYDNLMSNFQLVVVDASQCDFEQISLKYFRDLFNWTGTVNRYAIYANRIIIIMSFENILIDENDSFNKVKATFEEQNIYAGISSSFENIYDLKKYYNEAVNALEYGMKANKTHKHIFRYDKEIMD